MYDFFFFSLSLRFGRLFSGGGVKLLLVGICFVNYSSSENKLGFGLDNPKVCERGCPETVEHIRVVKCGDERGLAEARCRGIVFPTR